MHATNSLSLSDIMADPLAYDGEAFEGVAYVYRGPSYFEFYPTSVTSEAERHAFEVTVLAIENHGLADFETGDRVRLRATIEVPEACFAPETDDACAPWPHPVYLTGISILTRE